MEYLKRGIFRSDKFSVTELTSEIEAYVQESGIWTGLCVVYSPSVTSGLTITNYHDPKCFDDLQDEMNRLIPTTIYFKHQFDTPSDAAAHVKCSLMNCSISMIITGGKLLRGHSQGIFFVEFDGPRNREYYIKLIKEA